MSGPARLPDWDTLAGQLPDVVATMRRYLDQLQYVLRPRTVVNTELALRSLAAFLAEQTPQVTTVAAVSRRHIEDFKPWLAARRVCCIEPSLAILTEIFRPRAPEEPFAAGIRARGLASGRPSGPAWRPADGRSCGEDHA